MEILFELLENFMNIVKSLFSPWLRGNEKWLQSLSFVKTVNY